MADTHTQEVLNKFSDQELLRLVANMGGYKQKQRSLGILQKAWGRGSYFQKC